MTGRTRIQKYAIHASRDGGRWVWWARVPYGTHAAYPTWQAAADALALSHHLRSADNKTWRRR